MTRIDVYLTGLGDGTFVTVEVPHDNWINDGIANDVADALAGLGIDWGNTSVVNAVGSITVTEPKPVTVT